MKPVKVSYKYNNEQSWTKAYKVRSINIETNRLLDILEQSIDILFPYAIYSGKYSTSFFAKGLKK